MQDNTKKTLTIVIPTWNRARYLDKNLEILDSYLKCGLDFKILICNNGSTDNTSSVLEKWICHEKIRIINHPENIKYDRNVASGYLNFDTDFCFCLGDSKTLSFESLSKIITTINNEDIDALVINTFSHEAQTDKYFDDVNNLISELSVTLANISACVISKKFIEKERCERYYDSQFIHYGVFIDALCAQKEIYVKYDPSIKSSLISFPDEKQPHGWSSKVCSIWGKTWIAFIMSLPRNINLDTKWDVVRNIGKRRHIIGIHHFVFAKINRDNNFIKDYKENRLYMPLISTIPIFVYDILSFIPSFFYLWMRPILMRIPKCRRKLI